MFTNRDLRKIIIPLVIEFTLTRTISIIDSAMVSYAGDAAVSGVSLIDTLNLLFVYMFTSLSSGGAVIVSQSLGAEKKMLPVRRQSSFLWWRLVLRFLLRCCF